MGQVHGFWSHMVVRGMHPLLRDEGSQRLARCADAPLLHGEHLIHGVRKFPDVSGVDAHALLADAPAGVADVIQRVHDGFPVVAAGQELTR
jgi:hypothetical protein